MPRLAIVLSLFVLDACAAGTALRDAGDSANLGGCRDEVPCSEGNGGGAGGLLAQGIGAAALGIGVGALIYEIARSRPAPDQRPRG